MIVALLNQQHGVGKTTLALHLAGVWACQSQRVTVIDADPQGCALECSEMRAREWLPRRFAVIGLMRNMLHREAPNIAPDVDRVIVDGPSHIAALTRSALLTADLVLVSVQLPPFVRAAFAETLRLVNEANTFRPQLRTRVVLNRCDVRAVDAREIARALANSDPPALTSCIGQRVVLADAGLTGRLAFEMAHSAAAVREIMRSRPKAGWRDDDARSQEDVHGHSFEADTSVHQPRANDSISVTSAKRCIGGRPSTRCRRFAAGSGSVAQAHNRCH
jgi:chromosome partitioning protein